VNEIAKKGRVRVRQYTFRTDVLGGIEKDAILRDIHPDEAYELDAVEVTIATKVGVSVVAYLGLARNTSGEEPVGAAEEIVSKVGPFLHYEPQNVGAAGVPSFNHTFMAYPKPIHFDENDQLNAYIYNGAAQTTTVVFSLFYRLV